MYVEKTEATRWASRSTLALQVTCPFSVPLAIACLISPAIIASKDLESILL